MENYESFYLDFLEGNLDESDSAALFAFLEQHPDLIVEEDALAYLPEAEFTGLDSQTKSSLKFPDTEQKIGIHNIEIFLIASVENQLSEAKSKELQNFLKANPFYGEELSLYQRSRLQADLSIVFPEKRKLKKGIIVPMYARFAAAAASVILVVSLFNLNQGNSLQTASVGKSGKEIQLNKIKQGGNKAVDNNGLTNSTGSDSETQSFENLPDDNHAVPSQLANNNEVPAPRVVTNYERKLKIKPVKQIPNHHLFNEIEPAYVEHFAPVPDESKAADMYTMVEMKNPIKPITQRLASVIKQDVDFRTSKAARKKTGGFYLKIGKLEISRKIYDNSSVAVK